MKVLLVNGSPRPKGCTYTALSEVAETLNKEGIETQIFQIGKKPISGCIACIPNCYVPRVAAKTGKSRPIDAPINAATTGWRGISRNRVSRLR